MRLVFTLGGALLLALLASSADARKAKRKGRAAAVGAPATTGAAGVTAAEWLARAKVAQQAGDARAALGAFDQAAGAAGAADPAIAAKAHARAATLLLQLGQGGAAIERFEQSLQAKPDYTNARINLAHAHLQLQDHRQGLAAIRPVVAEHPEDDNGHRILGHLLLGIGDALGAQAAWRAALALAPADSTTWQALALSLFAEDTATAEAAEVAETAAASLAEPAAAGDREAQHMRRRFVALAAVARRRVAQWMHAAADAAALRAVLAAEEEAAREGRAAALPPALDAAFALVVPLPAAAARRLAWRVSRHHFPEPPRPPPATFWSFSSLSAQRRLRVGYIGAEFGDKPVGHLVSVRRSADHARTRCGRGGGAVGRFCPAPPGAAGGPRPRPIRNLPLPGWSHCRFVLPLIRFIPYLLLYSVALFLKRQCDPTLLPDRPVRHPAGATEECRCGRRRRALCRLGGGRHRAGAARRSRASQPHLTTASQRLRGDRLDVLVELLGWSVELQAPIASQPAPVILSFLSCARRLRRPSLALAPLLLAARWPPARGWRKRRRGGADTQRLGRRPSSVGWWPTAWWHRRSSPGSTASRSAPTTYNAFGVFSTILP